MARIGRSIPARPQTAKGYHPNEDVRIIVSWVEVEATEDAGTGVEENAAVLISGKMVNTGLIAGRLVA